jgi:hypothetical protein
MKKYIILILFLFLITNVNAKKESPKYKIIASSNNEEDIKELYKMKKELILNYKEWVESVDDEDQVLYDHQKDYNAIYKDRIFTITLGEGKGKELTGTLKVNYCKNTEDIEKKSLLFDFLL